MVEIIKSHWRVMTLVLIAVISCGLIFAADDDSYFSDSDDDGLTDDYELFFGLDSGNPEDALLDYDDDTLSNLAEWFLLTDPFEPDTDRDGFPDAEDEVPVSRAYLGWGDPQFTDGDFHEYVAPAWFLRAYRSDGEWVQLYSEQITDMISSQVEWVVTGSAWHVAPTNEPGVGSLSVDLDRCVLTNNLVFDVHYDDTAIGSLYVDLLDTNGSVVAENLFDGLAAISNVNAVAKLWIPLLKHPDAAVIHLRRGIGAVTVYEGLLYIDEDMDGLDADQERQLGTSDYLVDSDGDGVSDYDEYFGRTGGGAPPREEDDDDDEENKDDDEKETSGSGIIYVDQAIGDDTFTGRASSISAAEGPKKTVRAGLSIAETGDKLIIKSGDYDENLDIGGKNVSVLIEGNVKL